MPRPLTSVLIALLGFGALACGAFGVLVVYPRSALYHARAHELWQQQHMRHYEIEASWASNLSFGHVRAEVLSNRVVSGVDLETGLPLTPARQVAASYYVTVDDLFPMIQEQMHPSTNWRFQAARYHPLLARWLDPCAAMLPQISYDRTYGYPTSIRYRGTPCFNGASIYLTIQKVRPLP